MPNLPNLDSSAGRRQFRPIDGKQNRILFRTTLFAHIETPLQKYFARAAGHHIEGFLQKCRTSPRQKPDYYGNNIFSIRSFFLFAAIYRVFKLIILLLSYINILRAAVIIVTFFSSFPNFLIHTFKIRH